MNNWPLLLEEIIADSRNFRNIAPRNGQTSPEEPSFTKQPAYHGPHQRHRTAKLVETKDWPEFGAGDTVTVTLKIKEGNKERLQAFQGVVIQRRGSGATETFTVRKMASGVGVERIFPISSPSVDSIVVNKRGKVRRARIYYLRERTGKSARIKERRVAR